MPDEERDERPVFSWGSEQPGDGRRPSGTPFGAGGRPVFGIAARGRWVVLAAVVSATVGVFLFVGAIVGLVAARPFGSRAGLFVLGSVSTLGGIGGVLLGTRLALRLTDIEKTRSRLVASATGGVLGLAVGSVLPTALGYGLTAATPVLAIAAPGVGAVAGLIVPARLGSWLKALNAWLSRRRGPPDQ